MQVASQSKASSEGSVDGTNELRVRVVPNKQPIKSDFVVFGAQTKPVFGARLVFTRGYCSAENPLNV